MSTKIDGFLEHKMVIIPALRLKKDILKIGRIQKKYRLSASQGQNNESKMIK